MSGLVSLPRLFVELDGAAAPLEYMQCLGGMRVQQRLSAPTLCELTFFEPPPSARPDFFAQAGSAIAVRVEGFEDDLFSGDVTALEYRYEASGGRILRVRAYDRLHRLRQRQPLKVHKQVNLVELARDLVADLGLQVEAREKGPLWQRLIQHDRTDLELLGDVAARSALYFCLRDSRLTIISLAGDGPELPLDLGESLLEANFEINTAPATRSVVALAWDPSVAEVRQAQCRSPRAPEHDAGGFASGLSAEVRTSTGNALQSDEQAEAMAQNELDSRTSRRAVLWGVAEGDPALRPGVRVGVTGVAPAAQGRYVLTRTTHTLDRERGYQTEIDSRPPEPHPEPRPQRQSASATLGLVTDVNDPQELGRVRVELPDHGGLESEWLEVVLPAAGRDKGIVALPDVGDRVLVLFLGADRAQAVVLGGLYGPLSPPDAGVAQDGIGRFTLATAGGQRIQLNDPESTLVLETDEGSDLALSPGEARLRNRAGSFLQLDGDSVLLRATRRLVLEAPGGQITIRANAIDFERG